MSGLRRILTGAARLPLKVKSLTYGVISSSNNNVLFNCYVYLQLSPKTALDWKIKLFFIIKDENGNSLGSQPPTPIVKTTPNGDGIYKVLIKTLSTRPATAEITFLVGSDSGATAIKYNGTFEQE